MVVRHRYRERVIVQLARHKRADNEIGTLEGLVYGWRLVDTPGDRLKVANIEDPGIFTAIPANRIDGAEVIPITGDGLAYLHSHFELATLGMRLAFLRKAHSSLTIRQ